MSLYHHAKEQQKRTKDALQAHVATRELSGRLTEIVRLARANPAAFTPDDAAKLRDIAHKAAGGAYLIDGKDWK